MLEKTLENPLDSKEIQPVHPKGNQPWIFIGRTDTEAEAPILWPPVAKSQLIGKDPDARKDWGWQEKPVTEDEMVGWHHQLSGHVQFSSVSQSCLTLWPHEPQHARPPCPSPTPKVYSNSCPLSRWCHPTISSSVVPFSSHLQFFLSSGSFLMNQFFTSSGQGIGISASTSVLPMNIQDWFPLGWTGWISLQSKRLLREYWERLFSNITVRKHQFFCAQLFYSLTLTSIHDYWKNHSLD